MSDAPKNKGGRPKGTTKANSKKELKDDLTVLANKQAPKILKEALEGDELTIKEKAAIIKDLIPYAASKKVEDKKEIPEHLKYLKIYIKGYKSDEDPYADEKNDNE